MATPANKLSKYREYFSSPIEETQVSWGGNSSSLRGEF